MEGGEGAPHLAEQGQDGGARMTADHGHRHGVHICAPRHDTTRHDMIVVSH